MGYHKLHSRITFQDLPISVENPAGGKREWKDENTGEEGYTVMEYPYGYVRGTLGVDGDEVDVFLGPNKYSDKVFVITQNKKPEDDDGSKPWVETDEQKVMLGFDSAQAAQDAYLRQYDDTRFFGRMIELTMDAFKDRLTRQKGELIKGKMADNGFTREEAERVSSLMSVDLDKLGIPESEWIMGLNEELEHKDVTEEAAIATGKIALAHLKEDPHYYSKLKQTMEKGLQGLAGLAIMSKDNTMLTLSKSAAEKAFKPVRPKDGSEEQLIRSTSEEEEVEKSVLADLRKACAALDEAKMDLVKKYQSKDQAAYMHAAADRGEISRDVVDEFDAKTSKKDYKKLPKDKTPGKETPVSKSEDDQDFDIVKALRAIVASGMSRRARMDAAFKLGQAAGNRSRSPVEAEPVAVDLDIGTARTRPVHEPPVVPVRRVNAPQPAPVASEMMEACTVHGYVHKSNAPCPMCERARVSEAQPLWRR